MLCPIDSNGRPSNPRGLNALGRIIRDVDIAWLKVFSLHPNDRPSIPAPVRKKLLRLNLIRPWHAGDRLSPDSAYWDGAWQGQRGMGAPDGMDLSSSENTTRSQTVTALSRALLQFDLLGPAPDRAYST
jgi:hypothetical protein